MCALTPPSAWLPAGLAPLLLLLSVGCGAGGPGDGARAAIAVEVEPTSRRSIANEHRLFGSLEPASQVAVTALVSGRVRAIPVRIGDVVRRGEVLVELDRGDVDAAVRAAEAGLTRARARVAEASVRQTQARLTLQRAEQLQGQQAISDVEWEQASAALEAAQAASAVAAAEVRQAEATLAAARAGQADTRIVADWQGEADQLLVAGRYADVGTRVTANTTLLTLIDPDPLVAAVSATQRELGALRVGQVARVAPDHDPENARPGTIARIAPALDPASRQARVEIEVPNPDGALRAGMFITADIALDRVDDAQAVPVAALTRRDGADVVFVVDDGQADAVPVELGLRDATHVEVIAPTLTAPVVVLGHHLLRDGAAVRVIDTPPSSP